jgi:S1-C subfamily serine protease
LKEGDVIVAVKGERVTSQREFYRKFWALGPAGVDVPLTLHREGDTFNVVLTSIDRTKLQRKPKLH